MLRLFRNAVRCRQVITGICLLLCGAVSIAQDELSDGTSRIAVGVRADDSPVHALVTSGFLQTGSARPRVLLAVDVQRDGVPFAEEVTAAWQQMVSEAGTPRMLEVALLRIDTGSLPAKFPPDGTYYQGPEPVAQYVWRWIGMAAPNLVVDVRGGDTERWIVAADAPSWIGRVMSGLSFEEVSSAEHLRPRSSLCGALATERPCASGRVPAVLLETSDVAASLSRLVAGLQETGLPSSEAARGLRRRGSRSAVEVAEELSRVYGHQLNSVAYIPGLALIGRLRLSELTGDGSHKKEVLKIVEPYLQGTKSSLGNRPSGSTLSGHLVFGELAQRTGNRRWVDLVRQAADLGFHDDGSLRSSMPFHNEMSDAVFMGTPILVQCGRLTGETRYFDMAARHLRFMLDLNLREDGLHQHSPLDPEHTAWGRGNGFPALGLALSLSDLPEDSPWRAEFLAAYRSHLEAMRRHQDSTGMWHQIVDRPESYREFTVTCMTTFAILRGLRNGWLQRREYEPVVRKAWDAIRRRIGHDGLLVDVCTGTGKQKSRRDYYHRAAILGRDDRGGAMALLVSTELAFAQRENAVNPD